MEIIKKTLVILILCSFIMGTVPISVLAQPNSPGNQFFKIKGPNLPEDVEYASGEFIVQFKPGVSNEQIASINSNHGTSVIYTSPNAGFKRLHVPNGKSVHGMVEKYKNSPYVEYAEPNYKVYVDATIPNDYYFSLLWGMHNIGQSGGTVDADIDAPEAWDIQKGSNTIVVAVIDTGVDYNHKDLDANIWTNPGEIAGDGIDNDGNNYIDDIRGWDFFSDDNDPYDESGHGTHCSGTIAAEGNNGRGVVGVSWNAKIMPLRFLGPDGGYTSDAVLAINYAIKNGADIMSNSWGGGGYSEALEDAISNANDAGILFVASAGNGGLDGIGDDNDVIDHYPSSYDIPNVVSVAATDRYDNLASFSCYGLESVDLGAPGVTIASTYPRNRYAYMSGTSMAAPHVAGAAALIKAQYPDITVDALKARLLESTDSISSLDGKTVTGGRLNINNCFNVYIQPELSVIVTSPTIANIDESFAVEAIISNSGTETVTGVNATINLPKGLSLATGESQTKPTDDIINGDSATVSWTVNADTVGTYNITVEASATNAATTSGTANVEVIIPDTTPPIVTLTAPFDDAYITTESYTITATAFDEESGVALVEFMYLNGGIAWISIGTDTTSPYEVMWDLSAIDDQTGIQVKAIAINYAELTAEDVNSGITHDATPPTATISINGGAEYTTTTGVTLNLTNNDATSDIDKCRYSSDASSWSEWETCAESKIWTLTDGDGTKTVYYEVRDNAGNVVQVTDTIILDTTPPTGSVAINDGAIYTTSSNVTLTMSAADANGVAEIMVSNNGTFSDAVWEPYTASKLWTLTTGDGDKTVYVKYKDKAGFESTACSDDIILDTTPPAQVQDVVVTTISSSELGISWTDNTEETDLQHYNVYRSTTGGGPYDFVASPITSSYTDTGLAASTTYYYRITAMDEAGNEGVLSVEALGTTEAAGNVMHIASIDMSTARIKSNGWYTYATATVTVVDASGSWVENATVSGQWSSATFDSDSNTTDGSGIVSLNSDTVKVRRSTEFIFTVTDVSLSGWSYDPMANVETSDSITI